jgi:hypothetical protein
MLDVLLDGSTPSQMVVSGSDGPSTSFWGYTYVNHRQKVSRGSAACGRVGSYPVYNFASEATLHPADRVPRPLQPVDLNRAERRISLVAAFHRDAAGAFIVFDGGFPLATAQIHRC